MIPLVDLRAQYHAHKDEFDAALEQCILSSSFVGGSDHRAFAQEFAEFCGGGYAALCGNGTDALHLALVGALGQGKGWGEIITVSNTFIATAEAITLAGYRPVFVDVRPDTCLMNTALIEAAITLETQAILPVHLYGQMAEMKRIVNIARWRGLSVIEDACQAHGATWQGGSPGLWGDAACFSFYPAKNLGAWGDGGAVFSRDKRLIESIRMRANHGRMAKYEHEFIGVNSRLDGLQAAILRVKLRHLAEWNERRRQIATWYNELLDGLDGVQLPTVADEAGHVFHLYVVQVDNRDRVLDRLHKRGIRAGIHYPIPVHEQPAYAHLGIAPTSLPVTHTLAQHVLSLPIYPEMTIEQIETVVEVLVEVLRE